MKKLHLITGGQRSGKSSFAQNLVLQKSDNPIYLATARIWDDDFKNRVDRHIADRGNCWQTIEIDVKISAAEVTGRVVLLDCVTLWLTNIFFDNQELKPDAILNIAKLEFKKLMSKDAEFVVVGNEIGMGGHAANETGRKFTDLQGWMNQFIASMADEVTLMVSGIPVKVK